MNSTLESLLNCGLRGVLRLEFQCFGEFDKFSALLVQAILGD
ncbi:MAG: hypothetical protein ABGY32_15285 [bacterium]